MVLSDAAIVTKGLNCDTDMAFDNFHAQPPFYSLVLKEGQRRPPVNQFESVCVSPSDHLPSDNLQS